MQDGNRQEAVRQERIRIFAAKKIEEVARQCAISNAEHKAKYAAIVRRARMAKLTNSLPSEEEELQTPVAKHEFGHPPGQAGPPGGRGAPQRNESLQEKQPMHCSEVVQAVWGEKEMHDGNAQGEARQDRIRMLAAKRTEYVERLCAICNAAHTAKYAANVKAARLAKSAGCLPCAN